MLKTGDPGIAESLSAMWQNEDPAQLSRGMADAELMEYYGRVQAAHG